MDSRIIHPIREDDIVEDIISSMPKINAYSNACQAHYQSIVVEVAGKIN
jgi:hypothetical protein